jgi:phosphoribosylanthranilate isomerase
MTWIKICGTTNLEDARAAVEAGADALGFVFAPSARRISPKDAARIVANLPAATEKVGVFLNQKADIILDTVKKAGLTGVQLHGDEDVAFALKLKKRSPAPVKVYGVLPVRKLASYVSDDGMGIGWEADAPEAYDALLLDSGTREKRGGTGDPFEWQGAGPWVRVLGEKFKTIIAGGLRPTNVKEAIRFFHPWGVDVVSGVEREPGKKDHEKIRAFVKAVRDTHVKN